VPLLVIIIISLNLKLSSLIFLTIQRLNSKAYIIVLSYVSMSVSDLQKPFNLIMQGYTFLGGVFIVVMVAKMVVLIIQKGRDLSRC